MQETWMILELCDGGTLHSKLADLQLPTAQKPMLSAQRKLHILLACRDIAAGMLYLHDNDIVHGDLKASNILVRHPYKVFPANM